jgi:hypothetical protein
MASMKELDDVAGRQRWGFGKCMPRAGTGVFWTASGGGPREVFSHLFSMPWTRHHCCSVQAHTERAVGVECAEGPR